MKSVVEDLIQKVITDRKDSWRILTSEDTPEDVYVWLAKNDPESYIPLINNERTPSNSLELLIGKESYSHEVSKLVQHKNSTQKIWDSYEDSTDSTVRLRIAERTKNTKTIKKYLSDPHERVREWLAKNPNLPKDAYEILINDSSWSVRASVLENPNFPNNLFDVILKNHEFRYAEVKAYLVHAPLESARKNRHIFSYGSQSSIFERADLPREDFLEIYSALKQASTSSPEDLKAFENAQARAVHSKSAPVEVLLDLCSSNAALTRGFLADRRDLPLDAISILVKDKDSQVRARLASNPIVPREALERLVKDKTKTVREALMNQFYFEGGQKLRHENREWLYDEVKDIRATQPKSLSVAERCEQLLTAQLTLSEYKELRKEKALGIQVSATLRAAELGLISFKEARTFVKSNEPGSSQSANRWLEARLASWKRSKADTDLELILELGGGYDFVALAGGAKNITAKQAQMIIASRLPNAAWAMAQYVKLTPELLVHLANTPSSSHETDEELGEKEIGRIVEETPSGRREIRYCQAIAANHPDTPKEVLDELFTSRSKYVVGVLLRRKNYATKEHFVKASKDKSVALRKIVASLQNTPLDILEKLALDKEESVRESVKANPSATPEIKALIALA